MVSDRLLERYPEEADRRWIEYVSGEADKILKENKIWISFFLTPYRRQITEEILASFRGIDYVSYGGYPGAKRVRISAFRNDISGDQLPPLFLLHIQGGISRGELSEYDLLQAFYNTGLQEDMIGDMIRPGTGEGVRVYVTEDVSDRFAAGLKKTLSKDIEVKTLDHLSPDNLNTANSKSIRGTVASLRLDAIISLGCGVSRSKAVNNIKGGLVKVNWKTEVNPAQRVNSNDFIVLRNGTGFIIESLPGKSRKGRQNIVLTKYN